MVFKDWEDPVSNIAHKHFLTTYFETYYTIPEIIKKMHRSRLFKKNLEAKIKRHGYRCEYEKVALIWSESSLHWRPNIVPLCLRSELHLPLRRPHVFTRPAHSLSICDNILLCALLGLQRLIAEILCTDHCFWQRNTDRIDVMGQIWHFRSPGNQ